MSAPRLSHRIFASALLMLAAIGAAPMPAAALPDFRVQLFTTFQGTFDFAQAAAPVTAGPTQGHVVGSATLVASGFAGRGAVGGDSAMTAFGTPGQQNGTAGGTFAAFTLDDLIFSGPATEVTTSLNFHVHGTFALSDPSKTAATLRVGAGFGGHGFQGSAAMGNLFQTPNGLLNGIPWPDNVDADITTPSVTLPTGAVHSVFLDITLTVGGGTFTPDESLSANGTFSNTMSFPLSGPVFNLPPGFTANSLSGLIVNNQWVGGPQQAPQGVPEPTTLALLALGVGGLVVAAKRRRP